MVKVIGKVLSEPARGVLLAIVYHSGGDLSPGNYLAITLSGGTGEPHLLCLIEGPAASGPAVEPIPGTTRLSLRVVAQLHPQAMALWSLGAVGAEVLVPDTSITGTFFSQQFYSSSKGKKVNIDVPLLIGELRSYEEANRVCLLGEEMNSHTCILAQSGAGKSYAVGVVLEELAFETEANMIVFDLNSDYVGFREIVSLAEVNKPSPNRCRPVTDEEYTRAAGTHKAMRDRGEIIVLGRRGVSSCDDVIAVSFGELSREERLRLLRIDEGRESDQLTALGGMFQICDVSLGSGYTIDELEKVTKAAVRGTLEAGDWCGGDAGKGRAAGQLLERWRVTYFWRDVNMTEMPRYLTEGLIRVQRVMRYSFWKEKSDERTLRSWMWESGKRLIAILDLGAFAPGVERSTVAAHALESLWAFHESEKRAGRDRVTFLVVDEAHHLVPATPGDEGQQRTADVINRIAGEGRKYGLFLVFISQRPAKIHENTFTQADNYVIMKMQNEEDLMAIRKTVRGIPERVLELVPELGLGDALVAGKFVPCPALVRIGRRRTKKGGDTPRIPRKP